MADILDLLGIIWLIVVVGVIVFLLGGYIFITFAMDYSGFFSSKEVRKKFVKDVKKFIKYRFSKEKIQETRKVLLITIMVIIVGIVAFLFE